MKLRLAWLALIAATIQAADTSLFYVPIRNNDLTALRQLIRESGSKTRDSRGNSALMYSAAVGSLESMRLLLEAGADPNGANDFAATPLMWCAGDVAKVRLLLAKGADVNARSKLGRTPLLIAAGYDGATEVARLLLEKGADRNARDNGGTSVLAMAAASNNLEVARMLIAKGAEVNTADEGGFTPLHNAAGSGPDSAALVKLLLEQGARVNVKSADTAEIVKNGPIQLGRLTPLQQACAQGNGETVELLLKAGADVHAKDIREATPLVFAVATDHANPRIVKMLLEKGAAQEPAIEWARRYQNPEILRLFGLSPSKPRPQTGGSRPARTPREAVAKALSASQPAAAHFMMAGGCVACHADHLNGMAVFAAKPLGIQADYELETRQAEVTAISRGAMEQQLFQIQDPPPGVDGMQYSVLQTTAAKLSPRLSTDSLVHHIAALQRKDGCWPNYGAVRPPLEDGEFSHTAKGIRVLRVYPIPGRQAEFDQRVERAVKWLESAEPRTTEDRAMQLLGIAWAGRRTPSHRVQQLAAQQRADGGWGQTENLGTDAYATGEVLWALHESGMPASDPVYRRGVDYLLRTQQDSGDWHVVTRAFAFQPYFQSGFPHDHDQWISQAGTAMAAIGLTFAAE
ncbi:MAG: ankyrin repeat domain-containing protein [Bryobacteraceae bacterium]